MRQCTNNWQCTQCTNNWKRILRYRLCATCRLAIFRHETSGRRIWPASRSLVLLHTSCISLYTILWNVNYTTCTWTLSDPPGYIYVHSNNNSIDGMMTLHANQDSYLCFHSRENLKESRETVSLWLPIY